jgi:tripartite-type tricarboxylate transporter receptor subunit TctC
MKLPRRQFLHLAASAAALPVVPRIARAQGYPARPVRIIVPTAPAGAGDILARLDALPDVPTVGEFVPGYETSGWFGIGAPKNTPSQNIDQLNEAINAGLADPKIKARLADLGGTPLLGSPADFGKLIAEETEKWGTVVKFAGVKAD